MLYTNSFFMFWDHLLHLYSIDILQSILLSQQLNISLNFFKFKYIVHHAVLNEL